MLRELRRTVRSLYRTPVFAASSVLVLTLAVGANAAVLSLIYALVLRPLPVPVPHELVQLATRDSFGRVGDLTWGQFQGILGGQRVFSAVLGSISQNVLTVEAEGSVLRVSHTGVTGNYFRELGAMPLVGRLIEESDVNLSAATGEPVVVLSWSFWQRQYGGDPAILGRLLRIEGVPVTIVGVAPRDFLGLGITIEPDLTTPLTLVPRLMDNEMAMFRGTQRWVTTTGRLAPSLTLDAAKGQIASLWPSIRESALPPNLSSDRRQRYLDSEIQVESGATGVERGLRGRYTRPLYALLAIAVLVLLIAGVNLCSLVFARMDARRQELCVRAALGAARRRLIAELTLEGLLIGAAGALGGLLFASYTSTALVAFLLKDYAVPTALDVAPGAAVAAIAAATSLIVGVAITAVAAWIVTSPDRLVVQRGGSRSVAGSSRVGKVLVGAQAALSIVLLTHAALLGRNIYNINAASSGLTTDTVLVGYPTQRVSGYKNLNADIYYRQALDRIHLIPGVQSAAFTEHRPESGALPLQEAVARAGASPDLRAPTAETTHVSPGFFETMGITVVQGRDFSFADTDESPRVAIVSRHLARQVFGKDSGLGERIRIGRRPEWQNLEVVGIASDARLFDLRTGNLSVAYVPFLQSGDLAHYKFLVARASSAAAPALQQAIETLGAEVMPRVRTLAYARNRTLLPERVMAAAGLYFALLAVILVSAGMYGLLTYVLSLRRKEFGIRLALGADARRLGRSIAGDGLRVAGLGVAIGLAAAMASVRVLQSVLVATSP